MKKASSAFRVFTVIKKKKQKPSKWKLVKEFIEAAHIDLNKQSQGFFDNAKDKFFEPSKFMSEFPDPKKMAKIKYSN